MQHNAGVGVVTGAPRHLRRPGRVGHWQGAHEGVKILGVQLHRNTSELPYVLAAEPRVTKGNHAINHFCEEQDNKKWLAQAPLL